MRIAEWLKKETLRPGEAGGARPETWLYNFQLMKYNSTILLVQTWLTNCPAERRALLKVAHPVLTKCLQPSNPSKPLCSWFPRGFPRIQGGVLSASREGGAVENQSLCPPPPTHNRTGTAQLSSKRCNYVAIYKHTCTYKSMDIKFRQYTPDVHSNI